MTGVHFCLGACGLQTLSDVGPIPRESGRGSEIGILNEPIDPNLGAPNPYPET